MRRWNGWGDDAVDYKLPSSALAFLRERIGHPQSPVDATLEAVISGIVPSRLPSHPLMRQDAECRLRHARGQSFPDWVALRSGQIDALPDGVIYPSSVEDVRLALEYAKRVGAKVIPYGGGTSVVGHINPLSIDAPTVTVDLSRMSWLVRLDETSLMATFGAGVRGPDLEAQLRARGYTLGHFPQSFEYSTLGGWIATRSSGQQSLHYGRIEGLLVGLEAETPSGRLVIPNMPASAAGPNLRELVLGSEGRAGIITQATVRISRLPEHESFHAIFFPEFDAGMAAVRSLAQARLPLSMLRLSTAAETETTLMLTGHRSLVSALERWLKLRGIGDQKAMLLLGYTGLNALARPTLRAAFHIARQHGGVRAPSVLGRQWRKSRFRTPYLRNTLWELGYGVDTLETATSWANTPAMIAAIEAGLRSALAETEEQVHVFTHLSHVYPHGSSIYTTYIFRLARDRDETLHRWTRLKRAASDAIVQQGGTISHQHGVGVDHLPYLEAEKGALGLAMLRQMLANLDPDGLMNPGKLLS